MRRSPEEIETIKRAKARLDQLDFYPEPVRIGHVRILHVPWLFRLPWFRRFVGYECGPAIFVKRPLDELSNDLVTHELCHIWQLQHHPVRMPLSFFKTPYKRNGYEREARWAVDQTRGNP